MSHKITTKNSYEATAEAYAQNVEHLAPLQSIEKFIKLLPLQANIIDIGCGSGRDAKIFTERSIQVVGIDFCSNLLDIAKKRAPLAEFHLMDMESMTFPDASFDGAWVAASLLHIPKKIIPHILQKIYSLLKENGHVYFSLKQGFGEVLERDTRYDGDFDKFWSLFQEEELKQLLQAAKFKILEFSEVKTQDPYQKHSFFRVFCQKIS